MRSCLGTALTLGDEAGVRGMFSRYVCSWGCGVTGSPCGVEEPDPHGRFAGSLDGCRLNGCGAGGG